MQVQHIHLDSIDSTQNYLKEYLNNNNLADSNVCVSCDEQTKGIGRRDNKWIQFGQSLATSFLLDPSPAVETTPLEIAILVCDYFQEKENIQLGLKWPNDLLNLNKEKVGGIVMNLIDKKVIVGLGLNIEAPNDSYDFKSSFIELEKKELKALALDIYKYVLANRLEQNAIIKKWNELCLHQDTKVVIDDDQSELVGTFKGLNANGLAIIEDDNGKQHKMISGTLRVL